MGKGITTTTITFGVYYVNFAVAQAIGVQDAQGTIHDGIEAMVRYVNNHGGIAGRKLRPIYFLADSQSSSYAGQVQAGCTKFTEQYKVFAVLVQAPGGLEVSPCLAQHGVISIAIWSTHVYDQPAFEKYAPFVYQPAGLAPDRLRFWIDRLVAQKYFTPNSKIGLVYFEQPVWQRTIAHVIKPALAAHNLSVTKEAALSYPDSFQRIGGIGGEIGNAILAFKTANVDRVLFVYTQAGAPFLWFPQAETQDYHPRYSLTSADFPYELSAQSPASQLKGAVGVGWQPAIDVPPGSRFHKPNAAEALCRDIMRRAGASFTQDALGQGNLVAACDGVWFLQSLLNRTTEWTPKGLRFAADRLGRDYLSPVVFKTKFGPHGWDGSSAIRDLAFDSGCACFKYTSQSILIR